MNRRRAVLLALLVFAGAPALVDAVFVAPHAVFIDHETRAGEVTLGNDGETAEEITVELAFGFPDTDSLGTPFVRYIDDPGTEYPSAADWIRAFPRRVRLEPGDRQTVRLLARPPDELPDGEYWSRLIVTARGATVAIATGDTAVRAGLQIEFRLVVGVTYRKGQVVTGITLNNLDATAEGDSLVAWMGVERSGNGAFLGTARFDLLDERGVSVREWPVPLAIYYAINRRFVFPLVGVPPGDYRLAFRLAAERDDLEAEHVLPAPAVGDTVAVRIR